MGNDELTSALENIRSTAQDIHERDLKKAKIELQKANHMLNNSVPKHQVNQFSPLKHKIEQNETELRATRSALQRAEDELAKLKEDLKKSAGNIQNLKLQNSEKDGVILDNQKELKLQSINSEQLKKGTVVYSKGTSNIYFQKMKK